jgi:hypothetical protein
MLNDQASELEELARLFGIPVPAAAPPPTVQWSGRPPAAPVPAAPPVLRTHTPPPSPPVVRRGRPPKGPVNEIPAEGAKRLLSPADKVNIREEWATLPDNRKDQRSRIEIASRYHCTAQQVQALVAHPTGRPASVSAGKTESRPLSPEEKAGVRRDWGAFPEHLRTSTNRAALAAKYRCSVTQVFALTRADGHQERLSQLAHQRKLLHQNQLNAVSPSAATAAPTR